VSDNSIARANLSRQRAAADGRPPTFGIMKAHATQLIPHTPRNVAALPPSIWQVTIFAPCYQTQPDPVDVRLAERPEVSGC
jgi:hypothetical protein